MNRTVPILVASLLLAGCVMNPAMVQPARNYAMSPTLDKQPAWRTAVLPPTGGSETEPLSGLYDYAGMALMKTNRFTLLDRATVEALLREQQFGSSGMVDPATAVRLGKLLGAQAVMTVNVTRLKHDDFFADSPEYREAELYVKLIAVETAEVLYSATGEGSDFTGADGALRTALDAALYPLNKP